MWTRLWNSLAMSMSGRPRRRRQPLRWGGPEGLEPRIVMSSQVSAIVSTLAAGNGDNSAATARDLGILGDAPISVREKVDWTDRTDYFRFAVATPSTFSLRVLGGVGVELRDAQDRIISLSGLGGQGGNTIRRELGSGSYLVRTYSSLYTGIGTYDLMLLATPSDNSMTLARDLGVLGSTPIVSTGFVGTVNTKDLFSHDSQDYFRFTLVRSSDLSLSLSGLKANANVQLLDRQGRVVTSSTRGGSSTENIDYTLDPGTYFVRVYSASGGTNYDLNLSATPSDNSPSAANELGTLGDTPIAVKNFVGTSDTQDFFRFSLSRTSDVSIRLSDLKAVANVQLLDGQGRIVSSSIGNGSSAKDILRTLDAGSYFVRVYQFSGNTNYVLTLSATRSDNTLATANDLGVLSDTPLVARNFVGSSDIHDLFRFSLTQNSDVSLRLSDLTSNANLQLLDERGKVIAGSSRSNSAAEEIRRTLTTGIYFVRVYRVSGNTDYTLTLSAVPSL